MNNGSLISVYLHISYIIIFTYLLLHLYIFNVKNHHRTFYAHKDLFNDYVTKNIVL